MSGQADIRSSAVPPTLFELPGSLPLSLKLGEGCEEMRFSVQLFEATISNEMVYGISLKG